MEKDEVTNWHCMIAWFGTQVSMLGAVCVMSSEKHHFSYGRTGARVLLICRSFKFQNLILVCMYAWEELLQLVYCKKWQAVVVVFVNSLKWRINVSYPISFIISKNVRIIMIITWYIMIRSNSFMQIICNQRSLWEDNNKMMDEFMEFIRTRSGFNN